MLSDARLRVDFERLKKSLEIDLDLTKTKMKFRSTRFTHVHAEEVDFEEDDVYGLKG